ncbi:uncharacterized protein ISCGN_030445 [Ixodes scapularis]
MATVRSTGAAESAKKKKYAVKTEVLLDLIKQYPCLHDKRHPKYKDNAYKDELWGNLGVDLGGVEGMYFFCYRERILLFGSDSSVLQSAQTLFSCELGKLPISV